MKTLLSITLLLTAYASSAQYYYRDIIGTKESSTLIKTYQNAGVSGVSVASYDADNTRNEDLYIAQTFSKPHARLQTITRNGNTNESVLTSFADTAGHILKTIDSSAAMTSTTEYSYDNAGRLTGVKSNSTDSSKKLNETEVHQWQYNNGQVARMIRIINGTDTTIVDFKVDGGNVVEEVSNRRGVITSPVYYYYNSANQLTDIVRFNDKAKRLLPEYMFEYAPDGKVIQKITVPANSSAYLIWRYQYDASGLKIKEAIYDRYKTLNGKVEYVYTRN